MSEEKIKISVKNVTKRFELMKTRSEKILNMLSFSAKKDRAFWALKGVSFDVFAGEAIGVVGLNGSGKSTLLNIVSEIYPQTTGDLTINGNTSIISIGAGLKPALTGRDNIQLKLLMSGLTKKQIKAIASTIIAFSELGDFIDQPVKSYSSGMKAKLGFSIMAHTDPDIMIIDEALSVGDSTFANKSFEKIREFKAQGKTIFFVSHSASQVKQIADRVIWMHFGELREMGSTSDIMPHYEQWQKEFNKKPKQEREDYIVDMKHKQQVFSAADIAMKQLNISVPESTDNSRVARERRKELESKKEQLVKKATKQTQKKIQSTKFGILNWLVVIGFICLIGATSSKALADAQSKRELVAQEKRATKKINKIKPKTSTSGHSNKSTSQTSELESSEIVPAPEVVQPPIDANSNGIPDDQETVPDTTTAENSVVIPEAPVTSQVAPATDNIPSTETSSAVTPESVPGTTTTTDGGQSVVSGTNSGGTTPTQ
ncbi:MULTISPECIES: ABC transporter ATP-binding protein [Leuconostoc]|uniref:ABC transporter ATP-binding protein n=1 Tax=Leuconostoc kimchii TaxID=136609 RepID=A0ABX5SN73_9LACO|nr:MULTISPECIES: ABC transporter ATP-binding protein [Leuconostoc]KAA8326049.1 ABC transporter ATP-binding protein [Leuconostoc carnosum]QBR47879.1 ABC transporter ATP-binding protein [Leuconostoc kimchii]SPO32947.1 Teichoic acids export ATP-binding protein TagH [Leuconostoc carnosum]